MTALGVVFTVLGLAALAVLVFLVIGTWRTPPVTRRTGSLADRDTSPNPAIWATLYGAGGAGDAHHHHGHSNHAGGQAHGHSSSNHGFGGGSHGGGHGGGFGGGHGGGHG